MEKKEREEKKAKKQANPQLAQIKFLIKNNLPVEYYLGYSLSPKYTILIYSDGTMIFWSWMLEKYDIWPKKTLSR